MLILGIDPGSRTTGYALIEKKGRNLNYLCSGIIKFNCKGSFIDRLAEIYEEAQGLGIKYNPQEVAVESLIYVKSVEALAKLAQARGALCSYFSQLCPGKVYEYAPNLIKSSVTGHGHADKEGVMKSLRLIYGPIEFKRHDESDALAIATCHALMAPRGAYLGERV